MSANSLGPPIFSDSLKSIWYYIIMVLWRKHDENLATLRPRDRDTLRKSYGIRGINLKQIKDNLSNRKEKASKRPKTQIYWKKDWESPSL